MKENRRVILVGLTLIQGLALSLAAVPNAVAKDGEMEIPDPPGDARPLDPAFPAPAPDNEGARLADVTTIRVGQETGLDLLVEIVLGSLQFTASPATAKVNIKACFQVGDVPLALRTEFSLVQGAIDESLEGRNTLLFRRNDAGCELLAHSTTGGGDVLLTAFDVEQKTVRILVPKNSLLVFSGVPMLHPGDKLTNFKILAQALIGPSVSFHDAVPDEGVSSEEFVFAVPFSNQHLKLSLPNADELFRAQWGALRCSGFDRAVVGVQSGTYQTVPVKLQNDAETPTQVEVTSASSSSDWEAAIIPKLTLPPAVRDGAGNLTGGNLTITLILRAPEGTVKQCTEVRVQARVPGDPMRTAELVLDAVSTPMPSKEQPTLHFHATSRTNVFDRLWVGASSEDPAADPAAEIRFTVPNTGAVGSSVEYSIDAKADVAYPFDVLLDSNGQVVATMQLRSDPVKTRALLSLTLLAGGVPLAFGQSEAVIAPEGTDVEVVMLVEPDLWRSPTRRAPSDVPLILNIQYNPLEADPMLPDNQDLEGKGAGYVYLRPSASTLVLPISDTLVTRQSTIGPCGALVSLFVEPGEVDQLVNDGHYTTFNFTLTNEGVDLDNYEVSTRVSADPPINWTVQSVGGDRISGVPPGEPRRFAVTVGAPLGAPETATARVVVLVEGLACGASASSLVAAKVSKQGVHGLPMQLEVAEGGGSPGIGALAGLVAVASVLAWARRRQR